MQMGDAPQVGPAHLRIPSSVHHVLLIHCTPRTQKFKTAKDSNIYIIIIIHNDDGDEENREN